MHKLNITLLTRALTEVNNSKSIQALFKAHGEINDDPHNVFKLVPRPSGLLVEPKDDDTYEVVMGLVWYCEGEDRKEIGDIGLIWNTKTNQLTSAYCWGYSTEIEEWYNKHK